MPFELLFPEKVLLAEINNKKFKRDSIAKTYALALNSGKKVDWGRVNRAIIDRWSKSGLEYIKTLAAKIAIKK